jgi:uncharacterized Zn finger protein
MYNVMDYDGYSSFAECPTCGCEMDYYVDSDNKIIYFCDECGYAEAENETEDIYNMLEY